MPLVHTPSPAGKMMTKLPSPSPMSKGLLVMHQPVTSLASKGDVAPEKHSEDGVLHQRNIPQDKTQTSGMPKEPYITHKRALYQPQKKA